MKITLQVNGREITFSEEKLIAILEEYFGNKTQYFDVIPSSINRTLFQEKRADAQQEWTREIILEALAIVDKHPEKYANPFKVIIPEKKWSSKTVEELLRVTGKFGGNIASWIEYALLCAQRISKGETWEAVCNNLDTEVLEQIVIWKDNYFHRVGGSISSKDNIQGTRVSMKRYVSGEKVNNAVPVIVSYV